MSGTNKKGKGKSKDQENDGAGAFSVDFGKERGEGIYIPGSFRGLAGDVGAPPFGDASTTPERVGNASDTDADHSSPDQTKTPPPKKKKETED